VGDTAVLGPIAIQGIPQSLLWEVPLANQREPRMFAKFTSQYQAGFYATDTAIGGQFGVLRFWLPEHPAGAIQVDMFAAAFSRLLDADRLATSDYRFGVPVTLAAGPWQAKIAYEHTSTHLVDEFINMTGRAGVVSVRDEIVFGIARRFGEELRIYGQFGFPMHATADDIEDAMRYNWGIESSRRGDVPWYGRPFVAFDMDFRAEQRSRGNVTLQVGWHWPALRTGHTLRMAYEYYCGGSPYGQFFRQRESWNAFGLYFDW
jgi:hypothetical protein